MSSSTPDDLDALRVIVEALKPFESKDQERIIRWACEKFGLTTSQSQSARPPASAAGNQPPAAPPSDGSRPKDIRAFIETKNPQSDNQFAAAVAYFYRFEAPEAERKLDITPDDVQDATRRAGRDRLTNPAKTLFNAQGQGYFDKVERGRYALNTVGENLVAMALPQGATSSPRRKVRRKSRAAKTK